MTNTAAPATGLLAGLRILELGHYVAAPFAARLLADMGADVVKVEPPGTGDPVRSWGMQIDGSSPWWSVHGRNKRCVTLDTRKPGAGEVILRLARQCDIVIENYKPGQIEKWGVTPDALAAARPGLVLVRISGYGQTGPEARRAGFGVIGEAKGGIRHLCGYPPQTTELPPVRMGVAMGDSIAGLYAAMGALAAVIEGRASGRRDVRVIDVALGETVASLLEGMLPEYSLKGAIRQPQGPRLNSAAPSNAYPTLDGAWVLIAGNSDPLFRALAGVMGAPGLADDARFIDNQARCRNVDELDRLIGEWSRRLPAGRVLELLDAANIPASKIYTVADVASDPQYLARGMVTEVDDPSLGRLLHPGVVPLVSGFDRRAQIRWPGPAIGAHNDEVYRGVAGFTPEEIAAMGAKGLI